MEIRCIAKVTRASVEKSNPTYLSKVENLLHNHPHVLPTYVCNRMYERWISEESVEEALRHARLVDIQLMSNGDVRLLVRNMESGICVVTNPNTLRAITVYRNNLDDNHSTMRLEEQRLYVTFQQFARRYKEMFEQRRSY